jgi:glycosyltransferase involved in cell wall biosynthesis
MQRELAAEIEMRPRRNGSFLSVIIPVGSRHADLESLFEVYRDGLHGVPHSHEFIFVLDGPQPQAAQSLRKLSSAGHEISVIQLTRSFGQATALMAGFERAQGEIILTLPAYHQIDAAELPRLVAGLETADLCVVHRVPRAGGLFERMRRGAFHRLVNGLTGVQLHDMGCNARAMHRRVLQEISLYGDQHRFLAVLAERQGFRVKELELRQSPLDRFDGVYAPREYVRRMLDIFSILFLVRFTKRPLRFFGMMGAVVFGIGVAVLLLLVAQRLLLETPLADRPALLLSSLLVVLGLQLFALGLLGELIIFTHAKHVKDYQIAEIIDFTGAVDPNADRPDLGTQNPTPAASHLLASVPSTSVNY